MRRVVVSGIGVVAPVGQDLPTFWSGVSHGRASFTEARAMPGAGIKVGEIAGDVSFSDPRLESTAACDRSAVLALAATRSALVDAGLAGAFAEPERVAVVVGNGGGGLTSIEQQYDRLYRHGRKVHPFSVVRIMGSASASWLSLAFGAQGPCFVTSGACASATQAIGLAFQMVRSGLVDIAITGGTEAPLTEGTLLAWDAMRVMSRSLCRPFSKGRDGLMLAEGAGILVLEAESHALARGRPPRVAVAGFGLNADASDIVAPTADGMRRAMAGALRDADLAPGDVAYVNAHGTGTRSNDLTETAAMKDLFGLGRVPPISSSKGVLGHALGAAGGLEAAVTVLAMEHALAPPTANYTDPDPDCDLDVIPNVARAMPIGVAMSNSFAFGGLNASLVFRTTA